MKVYGTPDADTATVETLQKWLADNNMQAEYIMHYQRVPVDARPCKMPLSLTTQLILTNKRVVTAFQAKPGAKVQITIS